MKKISRLLLMLVLHVGLAAVFGTVTMYLWNALLPTIFALPAISLLQAVGLLVLARILFGGIAGGFGGLRGMGFRQYGTHPFREGWASMSKEQRKHVAEEIHRRHGFDIHGDCNHWMHHSDERADEKAEEKTAEKQDE